MYRKTHWLYLNIASPNANSFVPAWAAYRGLLATPNVLLDEQIRRTHLGLTPHLTRLIREEDGVKLEKELMLEKVRRDNFPNSVSRFNCIYCWLDEASARTAPKYWSNQGAHFQDRYLVEISVDAPRPPTIVDTRWIDRYVINSNERLDEIGGSWMHSYWNGETFPWKGEPNIAPEPLYEYLVEGVALIHGTELRMEAYSLIEKLAPEAMVIVEKGRLGVDLCTRFDGKNEWRLGQIVPTLMTNQERTSLMVHHLICLDETLAHVVNEKVRSGVLKNDEINHRALQALFDKKETFTLPDLRAVDADGAWINQHSALLSAVSETLTKAFLDAGGNIEEAMRFQATALAQARGKSPNAPSPAK
jgi:hypothetical protein